MRRALAACAVAAVALSACGGDGAASTDSAAPTTTTSSTVPAQPDVVTDATQPAQPTSGPGGSDYSNGAWRESAGGSGADAWYVFEPTDPQPASAPVTVVMHGYYEYDGHASLDGLIEHTVRTGSIVIYPRWQTDVAVPCPGPIDIEPCLASATAGIRGALDFLAADPSRVQPQLDDASYFGFSFGGIITTNLANRWRELDLPEPRAVFLDDPHDGGLVGHDEPALDDSLAGIPTSALFVCHVGAQGVISEAGKHDGSCNSLFPGLDHIPTDNKRLVLTSPDAHGTPALSSVHGVCAGTTATADAYDWNFCWRTWDALRARSLDDAARPDLGAWSDGVAIVPLTVRQRAPIRP